jgi:hypothetical protein
MKVNLIALVLWAVVLTSCGSGKESTNQESTQPVEESGNEKRDYPQSLRTAFDTHGGLDLWNEYRSLEYDLISGLSHTQNKEHHLVDLENRKVLIESSNFKLGFDGSEVWITPDMAAMGGQSPRFYHNLFFYFFSIPMILSDPGINYEDMGEQLLDEKKYRAVKISYQQGIGDSPEDYYIPHFDLETGQMEALLYTVTYRSGEATQQYNALLYPEWQEVDGLLVPAHMIGYKYDSGKLGKQRYEARFENVSFSREKPDQSVFEMPPNSEIDSLVRN